jgi:hypothetical protein
VSHALVSVAYDIYMFDVPKSGGLYLLVDEWWIPKAAWKQKNDRTAFAVRSFL